MNHLLDFSLSIIDDLIDPCYSIKSSFLLLKSVVANLSNVNCLYEKFYESFE